MDYSEVADQYKKIAKNQASAGEKLISLINFKGSESILDLGCGTGNLSFELSKKTCGPLIGIDPSDGMIHQAREAYGHLINFQRQAVEEMSFISKFDLIFCNSVFHWFKEPTSALKKINMALNARGVFALQTPVKQWCDFIVDAIDKTCKTPSVKKFISHYTNPWFHLKNAAEYRRLLEDNNFRVNLAQDETVTTDNCDLEKIIGFFNSGPALAYLNPENYTIKWGEEYKDNFIMVLRNVIEEEMRGRRNINISYNRAFLIAEKNI